MSGPGGVAGSVAGGVAGRVPGLLSGALVLEPRCLAVQLVHEGGELLAGLLRLGGQALEVAPDQTVQAIWDVVEGFEMPGSTIEGFTRRSLAIALAGIYDLRIHRDEVLAPVLRAWKVFDLEGLSPEAEQAREKLAAFMDELERKASRFEDKRAAQQARHAARDAARA